ncbi:hypothetical protein HPB50_012824 [Hyalomma asiaticum]|uniref:Uncharacterized protein n=1 Tax=Hyalomma asiaticum TaxID=266040 RepID=A0ACB7T6P4_HYAAI|nr:hypothetical protein HPB50_012824 [Hyalomma asiaticum]
MEASTTAGVAAGVTAEGRGPFYNMDAAPTADTTATPCVQPMNSPNDTPFTTDALDLDELSSASEDEGAVLETTSSASPGPARDTDANWKLAISRRQRQRQKKLDQALTASLQPTGPANTPPSHVAAEAAPAGNAPAAPADAASVAPAPTTPHVAEPRQLRRRPPPLPRTDIKIIMRPKKGLAIRNFTTHQISRAVAVAGNSRQHCTGDHFIIRTRPGSNIIIASTPHVDTAQILRRITTLAEGPATKATSSTRSNHPCPGAQPPSQRTHFTTQMVQQGERDFAQPLSLEAFSKPANKPNSNHPSTGTDNKVSWSAEAAKPIAPLHTQSAEYEHLLAENIKLKQELAAVRARQARDSAQLDALMARLGSSRDSPEHPSLTTHDRQQTSEIAIPVPTATGTAVTREEIREMLSTLNQQLSQQFSTVFTQFAERLDSLETRLESQIAETGGSIRRKRATRSSRSVTEPASHSLSQESHASELFTTPATPLGTHTLTPTSASQADIPTPTPLNTRN